MNQSLEHGFKTKAVSIQVTYFAYNTLVVTHSYPCIETTAKESRGFANLHLGG